MAKIRRHILFHGRVQGVGFRWNACCIARQYGITGWVSNNYDELQQVRWIDITDIDSREVPLQGGYGFESKD